MAKKRVVATVGQSGTIGLKHVCVCFQYFQYSFFNTSTSAFPAFLDIRGLPCTHGKDLFFFFGCTLALVLYALRIKKARLDDLIDSNG